MYETSDRRVKPRIECEYPAKIEGITEEGERFTEHGKLLNLSASGLLLLTSCVIGVDSKITVRIHLSKSVTETYAPILVTHGIVVRVEPLSNRRYRIAIKFNSYRFL